MRLHNLKPAKGSVKNNKRVGRGEGSGKGGTSTRGHKGAASRSGFSKKLGFEGGQMPLQRRIPKFGFKNPTRVDYKPVNLKTLQSLADEHKLETIDMEALIKHNVVNKKDLVKILGNGELTANVQVKAHAFSASAQKAIEAAGGKVEKI